MRTSAPLLSQNTQSVARVAQRLPNIVMIGPAPFVEYLAVTFFRTRGNPCCTCSARRKTGYVRRNVHPGDLRVIATAQAGLYVDRHEMPRDNENRALSGKG